MNILEPDKISKRIVQKKKSLELANKLKEYAENNDPDNVQMIKRITRQIFCANRISLLEDGSLISHFCGQKTCYVCNTIRMVKFIKKYLEGVKGEKYKYFVTLTIKNPNSDNLKNKIEQFYKFFQNSYLRKQKRFKYLNKTIKIIRSFEFTLNTNQKTYHIHLHLLLAGKDKKEIIEYGNILITYWKKYFNEEGEVSDNAQYLEEMKKGELENFKYMTKLDDINSDNIFMLYNMIQALFRRRLFMAKNIKPVKLTEDIEIKEKTEKGFEETEHKEDELNEPTINGKKVSKRFYFDYKNSNYIDKENKIFLLSKKQIKKIPRIIKEKKNFREVSSYFRKKSI